MASLLLAAGLVLLQGCAGTPVAEQLERSFAVPEVAGVSSLLRRL